MVSSDQFREAMSKFATGVTAVTTLDENGRPHAMTANSFTSVCLNPPTLLICVDHSTNSFRFLNQNKSFGINILALEQEDLGSYFAKRPEQQNLNLDLNYSFGKSGIPVLGGVLVFMGCKVVGEHVYNDHTIFVGEVEELTMPKNSNPLIFYNSKWYHP